MHRKVNLTDLEKTIQRVFGCDFAKYTCRSCSEFFFLQRLASIQLRMDRPKYLITIKHNLLAGNIGQITGQGWANVSWPKNLMAEVGLLVLTNPTGHQLTCVDQLSNTASWPYCMELRS